MKTVISFLIGLCIGWVGMTVLASPTLKDQIKGTYQTVIEGQ